MVYNNIILKELESKEEGSEIVSKMGKEYKETDATEEGKTNDETDVDVDGGLDIHKYYDIDDGKGKSIEVT